MQDKLESELGRSWEVSFPGVSISNRSFVVSSKCFGEVSFFHGLSGGRRDKGRGW